ncbi:MAG TPA: hypothetical protein VKB09_10570 [Thermomicrobiales bacterium]|nr:hypothetical protein [Thermomicrobiales bacterium]
MVRTRHFFKTLNTNGDVMRVSFASERGVVLRYVVQLEVYVDGRYYPAVRYDSAHDYPHRDVLDWEGQVVDKIWLSPVTDDQALTAAIEAVARDWPTYREDFLRRKP